MIGGNSFVANQAVLPAIDEASNAHVAAIASRSASVNSRWSDVEVEHYDAVVEHPDVDAVYIPLPNGMHLPWTERAAAAGKHVLCEKPLAGDIDEARQMVSACANAGVLLAEAWMTPFDRRWADAIEKAKSGAVGDVDAQHHQFTFTIGPDGRTNYRWDPDQGGGALLDLGIYTVGTVVEMWGTDGEVERVERVMSSDGVDATTAATLRWSDGRGASIRCSFIEDEAQYARFLGLGGRLSLDHAAFTSGHELDNQIVIDDGDPDAEPLIVEVAPGNPYRKMVEAFAAAVLGEAEWPRPVERSIELLELLERIRTTPSI